MGHEVVSTNDVNYDIAFQTIANNANSDVYFIASMWDPLHTQKLEALGGDKVLLLMITLFQIVHRVIN